MSTDQNTTGLEDYVVEFLKKFPSSARLCRLLNCDSGTYMDVAPQDTTHKNDYVVGNPDALCTIKYWLILPYGSGQALVPVDKSGRVRYLTPSRVVAAALLPVTVSPFPSSWFLVPPVTTVQPIQSTDKTLVCSITWPSQIGGYMVEVWNGDKTPGTPVTNWGWEDHLHQYWQVQFVLDGTCEVPPVIPGCGLFVSMIDVLISLMAWYYYFDK